MRLLISLSFLAIGLADSPDQITLQNNDRLSGTILKSDDKHLVLKTEFAGTVTVEWDAVVSVTATQPLALSLKDGQVLVGTVTTDGDRVVVATKESGIVTAPKDSITAIRNKDEQALYEAQIERLRNPRLLDLWTGFVDAGWARSGGNSSTAAFNLTVNASRSTSRDKISVYATAIRASNSTAGRKVLTANAERGGARYELNLSKKLFAFGFTDLEADEFQKLDLRVAPGGGFGFHAFKKDSRFLDFFGGGAYNREFFFGGINRSTAEVLFGNEIGWQLNSKFGFSEKFVIFPSVSHVGNYRINFDTSANTKLARWLSWQLTLSDRYLSNPVLGIKNNDVLFTTGVRVTFAK